MCSGINEVCRGLFIPGRSYWASIPLINNVAFNVKIYLHECARRFLSILKTDNPKNNHVDGPMKSLKAVALLKLTHNNSSNLISYQSNLRVISTLL